MKVTTNNTYKIILAMLVLWITSLSMLHAQPKEIRIGDTLPEAFIPEIIKYPTERAKLSDFKDNAILIDFWFTNCVACIAKFPFLDSISNENKDDLHILQVTKDSREKVTDFFTRSDRWKHIDFPCVVNDTVMNQLFPHRGEPHYVWVGQDGVVKAITDGEEVNRENLSALIEGRPFKAKLKDENRNTDQFWGLYPLMLDYPEIKDDLITYSFFAKSKSDGFRVGAHDANPQFNQEENHYRLRQLGTYFNLLYGVAYRLIGTMNFHPSKIIWETSSNERYEPNYDTRQNVFDYDLIVRDTSKAKVFKFMQADLDKYFGLSSSLEKRLIDVLVLKRIGESNTFMSKNETGSREQYVSGNKYIIKNIPVFNVIRTFNGAFPIFPFQVLNETGYNGQISIEIYTDVSDMEKVRNSFQQFGLDLVIEKREMNVIVLRD